MAAGNIVFLTRALDIGGAQRQMVELATGLKRDGWTVSVVTFYDGGPFAAKLAEAAIPHIALGKRGRWDVARFAVKFVRVIRSLHADVVHGYMDMSNILLTLTRPLLGGPAVVWGIAASHSHARSYSWLPKLEVWLAARLSRFADLIISNSEAARVHHEKHGFTTDRMIVIPNGIDVEYFKPDAGVRRRIRDQWGIDDRTRVIGMVGRLDPMKDHPNFLHAAAEVAAARPEARFVCVGTSPSAYGSQLRALARSLGLGERLIWIEEHPDIAEIYNAFDLVVSSSVSEGLPNVIVEAMATGVPCVVTDAGDSSQVVGPLGWVCRTGDSGALAAAIVRALDALPCNAGEIRSRICTKYSAQALVSATGAELARLVPRSVSISSAA